MIATFDDARPFFETWTQQRTQLSFILQVPGLSIRLAAKVTIFFDEKKNELVLSNPDKNSLFTTIPLNLVTRYEFMAEQDAPQAAKAVGLEHGWVMTMGLNQVDVGNYALLELKNCAYDPS